MIGISEVVLVSISAAFFVVQAIDLGKSIVREKTKIPIEIVDRKFDKNTDLEINRRAPVIRAMTKEKVDELKKLYETT